MLLGIIFLNTELNKPHFFARRNGLYALVATNKAKHILIRHCSCFCSDTIFSESIKHNRKKATFLKVYHFSICQHFPNVKVVIVQALIALYILTKIKLAPSRKYVKS